MNKKYEVIQNKFLDLTTKQFSSFFHGRSFAIYYLLEDKGEIPDGNKQLEMFKYIFTFGEEGKLFLWNSIVGALQMWMARYFSIDESLFSKEELKFINEMCDHSKAYAEKYFNHCSDQNENINNPIKVGNDYLLVSPTDELSKKYKEYFNAYPDEFESFFVNDYESSIDKFNENEWLSITNRPLHFAIFDTNNNDFVGVIGIRKTDLSKYYGVEYCIFKRYRRRGIAYLCMKTIINQLFSGKLMINKETDYCGIYKPSILRIRKIVAGAAITNTASINLLKKLGFKYERTIKDHFHILDKTFDMEVYSRKK